MANTIQRTGRVPFQDLAIHSIYIIIHTVRSDAQYPGADVPFEFNLLRSTEYCNKILPCCIWTDGTCGSTLQNARLLPVVNRSISDQQYTPIPWNRTHCMHAINMCWEILFFKYLQIFGTRLEVVPCSAAYRAMHVALAPSWNGSDRTFTGI